MSEPNPSSSLPVKLTTRLTIKHAIACFHRRAVLTKDGSNQWGLVCCTVEEVASDVAPVMANKQYPNALLFEDMLTGDQCLSFVTQLGQGRAEFGELMLSRVSRMQWKSKVVPIQNDDMNRAGGVIELPFEGEHKATNVSPLLHVEQPYYPDIYEAARDWLPFRTYHGSGDGRNDGVTFLLPEGRAYIGTASSLADGGIELAICGSEAALLALTVKGAWWVGPNIFHFDLVVIDSRVTLNLPHNLTRLDLVLLDATGVVYDFHREDAYAVHRLVIGRQTLNHVGLAGDVQQAAGEGEGVTIEFKPFVDFGKLKNGDGGSSKLGEVIETVAAFANTKGGSIFLGIEDDCTISGIDQGLQKWAKSSVDEGVIAQYLNALRGKIRDCLRGDVELALSSVTIDNVRVAVIKVAPAKTPPICIKDSQYLYARMGANNRKVPPDEWRAILKALSSN